jgi:hypothetical protein
MKYGVEMGPGAIICIPSFVKSGSSIQRLVRGTHRHTGDVISLLLFFSK